MALKLSFGLAVLAISVALTTSVTADEINPFHPEEPCNRAGGICTPKEDCPHKIESNNLGLCPEQQKLGAECCHGISTKEYRCRKFGGECFPKAYQCADFLIPSSAKDCASDQHCCILVN